MKYTFNKGERLKSRKLIEQLFIKGKRLKSFPLQMVYLQIDHDSADIFQTGFTVSKRYFKRAVDRNRIKRLMREAYRLERHSILKFKDEVHTKKYVFMFIYISNEMLSYQEIAMQMKKLLQKFTDKINE